MTTPNESSVRPGAAVETGGQLAPKDAPTRQARTQRLIEPRWQLGIACGVSLLILGSGALYMLGVGLVGNARVVEALGQPLHGFVAVGFDLAYFLGVVALVHRLVVRMTHSVVGPAFAIQRGLRALTDGDTEVRFKLRDGDMLTDVAAAAEALTDSLAAQRVERAAELDRIEQAAGDRDEVASALAKLRAMDGESHPNGTIDRMSGEADSPAERDESMAA